MVKLRAVFLLSLLSLAFSTGAMAQWPGAGSPSPGQPAGQNYGAFTQGNSATGGSGCYFGEGQCPLPGTRPSTLQPPQAQPQQIPPQQIPPQQTSPQQMPPQQMPPQQMPQAVASNICQTPQFWCRMFQSGPVGIPCYCNVPVPPGFVNGQIVPQ